jgi:hypothetical protein
MKTTAVITAIALAFGGAAFAQDGGNGPGTGSAGQANPQAAKDFKDLKAKTKRGMHRMGSKMRHAMHRGDHKGNTAAMGAPSRDLDNDAARQKRMDEAYANWQAKQAK